MTDCGWRTLIVDNRCALKYSSGNLVIETDEKTNVPIDQLQSVMISSLQVTITTTLLYELNKNNVKLVICRQKRVKKSVNISNLENRLK